MADFLINTVGLPEWLAWTITALVAAALILNVIAGGALVFIWAERKIAARIQDRLGPTRTGGRFGWLQSLADGIKLLAKEDLMPFDPATLKFDAQGLIACIAQDADSQEVLMLAWMNADAVAQTLASGRVKQSRTVQR